MDLSRVVILLVASGSGWLLATPLLALGDHLLAGVAADEAAPAIYATPLAASGNADVASPALLPLALAPRWRWGLRGGLALVVPLAVWRMLATSLFHPANLLTAAAFMLCFVALVFIAVLDGAAHLIFIESVTPPAALVALVGLSVSHAVWVPMLIGGIIGGVLFLSFYVIGQLIYGTDALGFGDVELAVALGIMLGWPLLLSGLIAGMLLLVVATVVLLALRRITTQTYMPIGTFLALGALVTMTLVPPTWLP